MAEYTYVGSELDLFASALNWKSYWSSQIRPFVGGDILEVGAGIGSNVSFIDPGVGRYVCVEPDDSLASQLGENLRNAVRPRPYEVICGTLATLSASESFDTIVYIDVLEHIQHDGKELDSAVAALRPGGRLIVLSPAHQRLFTPFDAAIGHFRRYNRATLSGLAPSGMRMERLWYLDSAGLAASTANLLLLRQSMPTKPQLRFWDGWIVPASRALDKLFGYSIGKSVVAVWRKGSNCPET